MLMTEENRLRLMRRLGELNDLFSARKISWLDWNEEASPILAVLRGGIVLEEPQSVLAPDSVREPVLI